MLEKTPFRIHSLINYSPENAGIVGVKRKALSFMRSKLTRYLEKLRLKTAFFSFASLKLKYYNCLDK